MQPAPHSIRVGIVGGSGYTGMELLRLLKGHRRVTVTFVTSEEKAGTPLPFFDHQGRLPQRWISIKNVPESLDVDLVYLCLPPGQSMDHIPHFLERGVRIVDLGADFRFPSAQEFESWYGFEHRCPALLEEAVYGLPEWNRPKIRQAQLIANPGCYPTAVLLALLPLVRERLLRLEAPVWIDAKSGVTGAGKSPSPRNHFVSVHENLLLYNPGREHRHVGEMEAVIRSYSDSHWNGPLIFTPQVIPASRGIVANLYVELDAPVNRSTIRDIYLETYQDEPFIRLLDEDLPDLHRVQRTNRCEIAFRLLNGGRYLLLFSAIDNLGKGASGQAVQNMNLLFGFPETEGLE